MESTNPQRSKSASLDDINGKGHGKQGVDKAPGEETPQNTDQTVEMTQKGKNKVDGDPSQGSDQPLSNE